MAVYIWVVSLTWHPSQQGVNKKNCGGPCVILTPPLFSLFALSPIGQASGVGKSGGATYRKNSWASSSSSSNHTSIRSCSGGSGNRRTSLTPVATVAAAADDISKNRNRPWPSVAAWCTATPTITPLPPEPLPTTDELGHLRRHDGHRELSRRMFGTSF